MGGSRCWSSPGVRSIVYLASLVVDTHKNFQTGKAVVPSLTVAVQSSLAEDLDVLSTPDPEGNRLLEGVVEVVLLPVLDIIGELHWLATFNQCHITPNSYLQFTLELHLNVIQKAKIQLLANNILLALLQHKSATVVRSLHAPEEIISDIIGITLRRTDCDSSTIRVLLTMGTDLLQCPLVLSRNDTGTLDDVLGSHSTNGAE